MKKCFQACLFALICVSPLYSQPVVVDQKVMTASSDAAASWLALLDKGNYGESWDQADALFRLTVPKRDWTALMEKIRKPLGRVISREILDQRVAADPQGLPPGDYMVLIYNTSFSNKSSAHELVTLKQENKKWKVLTYQVK